MSSSPASSSFPSLTYSDALTLAARGHALDTVDARLLLQHVTGATIAQIVSYPGRQLGPVDRMRFESLVARREISNVLDRLGVRSLQATNGREAWDSLQTMAARADAEGTSLSTQLALILADAEMPEMDGYVLTRLIKADKRFVGIPVVMHSSLSSSASRAMGQNVGVDAYVAKFDAAVLAETLRSLIARAA